jgi:hypothetical protein
MMVGKAAFAFIVDHGGAILKDKMVQKILTAGVGASLVSLYTIFFSKVPELEKTIADYKFTLDHLQVKFPSFRLLNFANQVETTAQIERLADEHEFYKQQAAEVAQMFCVVNDKSCEALRKSSDEIKKSLNVHGTGLIPRALSMQNLTHAAVELTSLMDKIYNCHDDKVQCERAKDVYDEKTQSLEKQNSEFYREIQKTQRDHHSCLNNLANKNAHYEGVQEQHGIDTARLEREKNEISDKFGQMVAKLERDKAQLEKDKAQHEREKKDMTSECSQQLLACEKEKTGLSTDKATAEANFKHCEIQKTKAEDALSKCQKKGWFS